jgi:hypothetical protein
MMNHLLPFSESNLLALIAVSLKPGPSTIVTKQPWGGYNRLYRVPARPAVTQRALVVMTPGPYLGEASPRAAGFVGRASVPNIDRRCLRRVNMIEPFP